MTRPGEVGAVDVLVVGAGPTGLLAGILLSRAGLSALVVERQAGPRRQPAAHVVNARTFEVFRQAGIDVDRLVAAAAPVEDSGHVCFVTRLAGQLVGRLPYERQSIDDPTLSPTPLRNLSQHRLDPLLAEELEGCSGAELRYGVSWLASAQDASGVTSELRDEQTGTTVTVRSRYVVACDGAGSGVRKALGIELDGPPDLATFLMVHLRADLRAFVADRPGILHFVLDPEAEGVFVAHDIDREWVFMHGIDPSAGGDDGYDEQRCRRLVLDAIGADADLEVLGTSTWRMSAQVARELRRGRIFLAGDAAHRFPPTGGLGLNTGAQDVHALVWRLRAVEEGWGGEALLDAYAQERLPVARVNAEQSLANAGRILGLAHALGTDVEPTTARLHASLADPERAPAIRAAVADQAEHFDLIGLQLGYVYDAGALVPEPGADRASPTREYRPTARPGARLPHACTSVGGSTLDLVDAGRLTLLTAGDHEAWAAAWPTAVPVTHIRLGVAAEVPARWLASCAIGPTGALLVRPDQHVAWRAADSAAAPLLAGATVRIVG